MNARTDLPLSPGIHSITAAAYHADPCETPSLSNSLLKTLLQGTPRHAWLAHPRLNPSIVREEKDEFDLGATAHDLLLEGGTDKLCVIQPEDYPSRPTKKYPDGNIPKGWTNDAIREARDTARSNGLIPLLPWDLARAKGMVDAAHAYIATTGFAGIFGRGKAEQTVVAKIGGAIVRCRIDWLTDDVVLDYKTTGAGGPAEWCRKNIVAHGYDTQSVLYPKALAAVGHPARRFVFLVQETTHPFMCYLVEPAGSMVELAESKINRGLQLWKDCLARDVWPGYPIDVHQAEAPVWAMQEEEAAA